MNTIRIPHNGLPKEVTDIPYGQVFVLINPQTGITSKTIQLIESIHSIAEKNLGQKNHIVNTLSVQTPELWDCFVCKVEIGIEVKILVANKDSLIEMLCVFYRLDYKVVCKTIVLRDRYKNIPYGGDIHPIGVLLKPGVDEIVSTEKGDSGVTLQLIQNHTRQGTLGDIRSTFKDNFNYNLGISLDEIIELYKDEEKNRRSYRLDIKVNWKEVKEYKHPKWVIHKKMTSCDISLIDNFGNSYPIIIDAMTKAIYLTFMLFEDGIEYTQITYSDEFYDIFKKIYNKLPRAKGTPRRFNLENKADLDTFTNYTSKTRQAILKVTNDIYAEEQFAIEGRKKDTYGIAGATAENRDKVRKEFNIK